MTTAYWCVLVVMFLPLLCALLAKLSGGFNLKDNHDPRAFYDTSKGVVRRLSNAQNNGFEAFPAFAAAIIIAQLVGQIPQDTINLIAILYVISRLVYIFLYAVDWAILRSLAWGIGVILIVSLFVLPCFA